jgi:hypothetical protein
MGLFAVNAAVAFEIGSARGGFSILSAMEIQRDEFLAGFGYTINDIILKHRENLARRRQLNPSEYRSSMRWVDGTPEYSLHIYALRQLFPAALFIHIVRDAHDVVKSMLNFHRLAGFQLVQNEEEAYKYWLRMVKYCVQAEQAYGPDVVRRVRYAALLADPEAVIRSLLEFVGEQYAPKCLEPLSNRINSSNVPADFKSDDPATDSAVLEEATRLSETIEVTAQPGEASSAVLNEMETAFRKRVQYVATLDDEYQQSLRVIRDLKQSTR